MARNQLSYTCSACGGVSLKWQGQCPACGGWNTLGAAEAPVRLLGAPAEARALRDLGGGGRARTPTGFAELDRVLGGGLVPGAAVLVGGPPGIGKSTLLLQVASRSSPDWPVLYTTGEESLDQVATRAARLGVSDAELLVTAASDVAEIMAAARRAGSRCVVVDSIQTATAGEVPAAAGSPSQLRECADQLIRFAKSTGVAVILVGHVTKEGLIAGPRILEHMVDVVLYFEDEVGSRFRVLRAVKNRFGALHEIGIFAMAEDGLREVRNPSAIFLSRQPAEVSGSAVTVLHQGTRPLLVEVQALADAAAGGGARRLAVGIDPNRLALLLAALHRHGDVDTHGQDVFVNVVGGLRVSETAADLAVLAAVASSVQGRPLPPATVVFGEVGLGGEIRPVPYGEERLREAAKLGFRRAVAPRANAPRSPVEGLEVAAVASLAEALRSFSAR